MQDEKHGIVSEVEETFAWRSDGLVKRVTQPALNLKTEFFQHCPNFGLTELSIRNGKLIVSPIQFCLQFASTMIYCFPKDYIFKVLVSLQ